jgi:prevent-host-death family protein
MSSRQEPLAQAGTHLEEVVDRACQAGEPTVLTDDHGRPAAVVIPHTAYENYQRLQAEEDLRAITAALARGAATSGGGHAFTSVEEMLSAAQAARTEAGAA